MPTQPVIYFYCACSYRELMCPCMHASVLITDSGAAKSVSTHMHVIWVWVYLRRYVTSFLLNTWNAVVLVLHYMCNCT